MRRRTKNIRPPWKEPATWTSAPQVDGYLDKRSTWTKAALCYTRVSPCSKSTTGCMQPSLKTTKANLQSAKAAEESAQINVDKLMRPLYKTMWCPTYSSRRPRPPWMPRKQTLPRPRPCGTERRHQRGLYPRDGADRQGYIGRIPYKIGSLVGRTDPTAPGRWFPGNKPGVCLLLHERKRLRSLSSNTRALPWKEKVKQMPEVGPGVVGRKKTSTPVRVRWKPSKGQFRPDDRDHSFPRSVLQPGWLAENWEYGPKSASREKKPVFFAIPQAATYELQGQGIRYLPVGDSNKVASKLITITGSKGKLLPGIQGCESRRSQLCLLVWTG